MRFYQRSFLSSITHANGCSPRLRTRTSSFHSIHNSSWPHPRLSATPISYHFYADDTQLYISFESPNADDSLTILSSVLDSVHTWLTSNRLSVNPSKNEYLIIGTHQQRAILVTSSISFQGTILTPTDSTRNLGVIFDKDLSFKNHISTICKTSYYHIRQIRQVRSSLYMNSAIILANSLVSSKLDYCNSLYYGLPAVSIDRLQKVQNSLARVVDPSVRRHHHITPTLKKLHRHPIHQRIHFKIASLTFKALQNRQPSYLSDLLTPYVPSRNLRSLVKHLLTVPDIRSANGRRSFFFSAPTIWNSLPIALRSCPTPSMFLSWLKDTFFPTIDYDLFYLPGKIETGWRPTLSPFSSCLGSNSIYCWFQGERGPR